MKGLGARRVLTYYMTNLVKMFLKNNNIHKLTIIF